VVYTRTRLLTLRWGHHYQISNNRLQDALTRRTPPTGMSAHIHRDKQPHADPRPDGPIILPLHVDTALRLPQLLATASKQLPGLYRTTSTSFHAPLPNASPIRTLSTITGDAPRPLSACDAIDSNDDICLHPVRHAHMCDSGASFRSVAAAGTLAKATRMLTSRLNRPLLNAQRTSRDNEIINTGKPLLHAHNGPLPDPSRAKLRLPTSPIT
jgi:hypothetical protein